MRGKKVALEQEKAAVLRESEKLQSDLRKVAKKRGV